MQLPKVVKLVIIKMVSEGKIIQTGRELYKTQNVINHANKAVNTSSPSIINPKTKPLPIIIGKNDLNANSSKKVFIIDPLSWSDFQQRRDQCIPTLRNNDPLPTLFMIKISMKSNKNSQNM